VLRLPALHRGAIVGRHPAPQPWNASWSARAAWPDFGLYSDV